MLGDGAIAGAAALGCIFVPLVAFVLAGASPFVLRHAPSERTITRLSSSASATVALFAALLLVIELVGRGEANVVETGPLLIDRLSAAFALEIALISFAIGRFSASYLHRDAGFLRFYTLLHAFELGALLVVFAGSLELLLVGWELVGLCSVFLIAFFYQREAPAANATRVLVIYRCCDAALVLGIALLQHFVRDARIDRLEQPIPASWRACIGILLLAAAIGKSAQFPLTGWLPRAMEGPTPSSALFYGGISIHLGAYLLLRAAPLLAAAPGVAPAVVAVGMATALVSTLCQRVVADAKNALAFAAATQVGLIFAEIGMGFYGLAIVHLLGHTALRTWQLLRVPSLLHDTHALHAAAGASLTAERTGALPSSPLTQAVYAMALVRFGLDEGLDRVVAWVLRGAGALSSLDRRCMGLLVGLDEDARARPSGVFAAAGILAQEERVALQRGPF